PLIRVFLLVLVLLLLSTLSWRPGWLALAPRPPPPPSPLPRPPAPRPGAAARARRPAGALRRARPAPRPRAIIILPLSASWPAPAPEHRSSGMPATRRKATRPGRSPARARLWPCRAAGPPGSASRCPCRRRSPLAGRRPQAGLRTALDTLPATRGPSLARRGRG